jgi:hypothetical protein
MNISVKIEESVGIPEWATTDWNVYEQILFHIYTNAIKFNTFEGAITISFSWIPIKVTDELLEEEFQT